MRACRAQRRPATGAKGSFIKDGRVLPSRAITACSAACTCLRRIREARLRARQAPGVVVVRDGKNAKAPRLRQQPDALGGDHAAWRGVVRPVYSGWRGARRGGVVGTGSNQSQAPQRAAAEARAVDGVPTQRRGRRGFPWSHLRVVGRLGSRNARRGPGGGHGDWRDDTEGVLAGVVQGRLAVLDAVTRGRMRGGGELCGGGELGGWAPLGCGPARGVSHAVTDTKCSGMYLGPCNYVGAPWTTWACSSHGSTFSPPDAADDVLEVPERVEVRDEVAVELAVEVDFRRGAAIAQHRSVI